MRLIALLACLCAACLQFGDAEEDAQDEPSTPAPFAGTWVRAELGFDCTRTLILGKKDGSDAYEVDLLCSLSAGGLGLQAETGSYAVSSEGKTTFTPQKATCASDRVSTHQAIVTQIDGQLLRVATPTGIEIYERASPSPIPSGVMQGCFDGEGRFDPRALADL